MEISRQIQSLITNLKICGVWHNDWKNIVCSMWSSIIRNYLCYYFLPPRRLLTVAPHKIITNLWLAYTVFDALMHYGIASKLAHVLFFDACVKSHAFLRTPSERFYWITCASFIFVDACVNRMRLFAAKKSQRILSECTLTLMIVLRKYCSHLAHRLIKLRIKIHDLNYNSLANFWSY